MSDMLDNKKNNQAASAPQPEPDKKPSETEASPAPQPEASQEAPETATSPAPQPEASQAAPETEGPPAPQPEADTDAAIAKTMLYPASKRLTLPGDLEEPLGAVTTKAILGTDELAEIETPDRERPALQPDTIAIYLPGQEKPLTFTGKDEILLGRGDLSSVPPPDIDLQSSRGILLGVSRKHAVIRRQEDGYHLEDLYSTNGTWLNGKLLTPKKPYQLHNGDQIRLGQLLLFIYFSVSDKNAISTIYLEDESLTSPEKLQEGFSLQYLSRKVTPYLKALADLQKIFDETKDEASRVNILKIAVHKDGKRLEVNLRGVHQAIEIVRDKIAPLRKSPEAAQAKPFLGNLTPVSVKVETPPDEKAPETPDKAHQAVAKEIVNAFDPTPPPDKWEQWANRLLPLVETIAKSDLTLTT